MHPSLKALWVEALRSGRYQQAQGTLKREWETGHGEHRMQGFCCLGVLCKVMLEHPEHKPKELVIEEDNETLSNGWEGEEMGRDGMEPNELSIHLQYELGISQHVSKLMSLNDGSDGEVQRNFGEIADYIERSIV